MTRSWLSTIWTHTSVITTVGISPGLLGLNRFLLIVLWLWIFMIKSKLLPIVLYLTNITVYVSYLWTRIWFPIVVCLTLYCSVHILHVPLSHWKYHEDVICNYLLCKLPHHSCERRQIGLVCIGFYGSSTVFSPLREVGRIQCYTGVCYLVILRPRCSLSFAGIAFLHPKEEHLAGERWLQVI
jgi:hypothetical protein